MPKLKFLYSREMTNHYLTVGAGFIIMGLVVFSIARGQPQHIELRLLIPHTKLFAEQKFAEALIKESDGEITAKILTHSDFGIAEQVYGTGPKVLKLLNDGEVDSAIVSIGTLGARIPQFYEILLPFLFENFDTAFATLNVPSSPGKYLLERLSKNSNIRGLAFWRTGNFAVLITPRDATIKTINDLRDKKIVTIAGKVGSETLRRLGAVPLSNKNEINIEEVDGVEAIYSTMSHILDTLKNTESWSTGDCSEILCQFLKKYYPNITITETNHSLILSVKLIRSSFYEALSPKNRRALERAVMIATESEWRQSVPEEEEIKQQLEDSGVTIIGISPETKDEMKQLTRPVYDWFRETIGPISIF